MALYPELIVENGVDDGNPGNKNGITPTSSGLPTTYVRLFTSDSVISATSILPAKVTGFFVNEQTIIAASTLLNRAMLAYAKEDLAIADNAFLDYSKILSIKERINVDEKISTTQLMHLRTSSSTLLKDSIFFLVGVLVGETVDTASVVSTFHTHVQGLTELLHNTDVLSSKLDINQKVSEALLIVDALIQNRSFVVKEEISAIAVVKAIVVAVMGVLETLEVVHTFDEDIRFVLFARDTVNLDEMADTRVLFNAIISEAIVTIGDIAFDNEHYTLALNAHTLGLSTYENYNFNSMSNGLAANATGIYSLDGVDDNGVPISARIKTGLMDFGSNKQKQVPYAYIGMTKSGSMVLKTVTDLNGKRKERWYKIHARDVSTTDNVKVKMGKGVKSRYWQFEISNKDGSTFEIDDIELVPLMLRRKV